LALTAVVGSVAFAPPVAVVWLLTDWRVALLVWLVWLALCGPFLLRGPANALGRSIVGWREPLDQERAILHHALVRACVAAGNAPADFVLRVARGRFNAYASGRNVLAVTEDVLSGDTATDGVELEAMMAHELAHYRHGDLLLHGPRWWLLAPLVPFDLLCRALLRVPLVGAALVSVVQLPFRTLILPLRAVTSMASRPRELAADRFAVDCGYAVPLERVFTRFAHMESPNSGGMITWMLSTHPGPTDRITHIRNAGGIT
jgi:Zn-dependent protease with chaperone function